MLRKVSGLALFSLVLSGCGGDPKDPQTWVGKLDKGAERQEAVEKLRNLFRDTLNAHGGNHDAAPVKALAGSIAPGLVAAARKYKDDHESREDMLELLAELRDRRAVPVFIEALDFTPEISEEEAIAGAQGLGELRAREGVQPLLQMLGRVTGNRAVDNRVKQAVIVAFQEIRDPAAVPAIIELLDKTAEEQDFFINKLATVALGEIADPRAVPVLIRALYMAGRGATIFQQARVSLAQIGPPAVPHLVKAMKREDAALNAMNKTLDFDGLNPGVHEEKCAMILADLGDPSAIDALVALLAGGYRPVPTGEPSAEERDKATIAKAAVRGRAAATLARIASSPEQLNKVVDAILPYASEMPESAHTDLYKALGATGLPRALEFLEKRMTDRAKYGEVVRFWAADWYAYWGGRGTKAAVDRFLATEPEGAKTELATDVERIQARAAASEECGDDVGCWVRKLEEARLGGQAADRLGRLGMQGNAEARAALLQKADHSDKDVRRVILDGLGRAFPQGCAECMPRLEGIIAAEQGRQRLELTHQDMRVLISRWRHFGGPGGGP